MKRLELCSTLFSEPGCLLLRPYSPLGELFQLECVQADALFQWGCRGQKKKLRLGDEEPTQKSNFPSRLLPWSGKDVVGCLWVLRGEVRKRNQIAEAPLQVMWLSAQSPLLLPSLVTLPFKTQKLHSCLKPSPGPDICGWKWGASREEMKEDRDVVLP